MATLYLPSVLLMDGYPVPSPYASCDAACPPNAFQVVGSEPAFVDAVLVPLRELLTILLYSAVTFRLGLRVRRASPLMRQTLSPVLLVATTRVTLFVIALSMRRVDPESPVLEPLVWALALALPAMALAFLVGLLRWRFFLSDALEGLALRLRRNLTSEDLRSALAEAFGDPSLSARLPRRDTGGWIDAEGMKVELPSADSGRRATMIPPRASPWR